MSTLLLAAGNASLAADTFRAAASVSPMRSGIVSVIAADFNGDGIADLATADAAGISVGGVSLAFPNARAAAAADFDGDGRVDLVAVSSEGRVAVWMNDGSGGFRPGATVETGAAGHALVAADFDGDGRVDLAVSGGERGRITMLYRQPEGGWCMEALVPGANAWGLAVGDFDGDGRPELAVARGEAGVVLLNPRGGAPVELAVEGGARWLAAADFDGDGKVDLAVAGRELRVLLNEDDGRFSAGPTIPAGGADLRALIAADFTGDGLPDLVVPLGRVGAVALLASAGGGRFASPELYAGGLPYAVAAADFDGDGRMDVAVVTERGVATLVQAGRTVSRSAVRSAIPSSVALAASPSPSTYGQAVTLTATVTAGATGKVTFYDGTNVLGTAPVSGGTAALTTRSLAAGARSLQAVYAGDGTYASSSTRVAHSVSVVPNNGFHKPLFTGFSTNVVQIVAADFNGDGKQDLASISIPNAVTVALGRGDGTFGAPTLNDPLPWAAAALVASDFNGDGKMDLAIGYSTNSNSVTIRLGNGDGTFHAGTSVPGVSAWAFVVADFNLDGKPDIAALQATGATLMKGKGDGTFDVASILANGNLTSITAGDLNGDGLPDLIFGLSGQISVSIGNGDGSFQSPVTYTGSNPSRWLVVDDFNLDGRNDVMSRTEYGIDLFPGNGDGTVQAVKSSSGAFSYAVGAAAGDFNGDGKPDFAVSYYSTGGGIYVSLGNGDGTFQTSTFFQGPRYAFVLAVADFDGDGRPDLAVGGNDTRGIAILLAGTPAGLAITTSHTGNFIAGDTGKTYQISVYNPNFGATSGTVTVVDTLPAGLTATAISGSGWNCTLASLTCSRTDSLATGSSYPDIKVTVNVAASLPASTITNTAAVTASSITNSATDATRIVRPSTATITASPNPAVFGGVVTLTVTVSDGAQGTVSIQDGGTWVGSASLSGGQAVLTIRTLAVGKHSLRSIYSGSQDHGASVSAPFELVVQAQPSSGFGAQTQYASAGAPWAITMADFNGDGKQDLATANTAGYQVAVLLGNGNGTFGSAALYPVGTNPEAVAAADFNGDGRPDLAVTNRSSSTVSILLGNGNGTFQAAVNYSSCDSPRTITIADVNLDGRADLLIASGSYPCTLMGNGDGTFQPYTLVAGASAHVTVIGDVNSDGVADLVQVTSGTLTLRLGRGDGTFTLGNSYSVPYLIPLIALADWNGDGKVDLVLANFDGVAVLPGNGNGTFGAILTQRTLPVAEIGGLVVADQNGDGRLDAIVTHPSSNTISVLLAGSDGTLQPAVTYSTGSKPHGIVAGDFNGDGRTDLAIANETGNSVSVLPGALVPVLSIQKTHQGNFSVGKIGAIYSITVGNSGPGVTSGTVTVTESIPTSLTLVSMTGAGWTCPAGGATCTRSDALSPGAFYPAITVTVNVSQTITSPIVNVVTVAGGGANGTSTSDTVTPGPRRIDRIGVFRNGTWFLDWNGNGAFENWDRSFSWWGGPGSIPVTGDWNGDGKTKAGFFKDGLWYLDYDNSATWDGGAADKVYGFGWAASGITPLVGDWNGDGRSKVGVFYNGFWYLDYNGNGVWDGPVTDRVYGWGWAGTTPLVGDWNGDGRDKIGFFINGYWYLDYDGNGTWDGGVVDKVYGWGWNGVTPLVGDWNGDGRKKIGFFVNGYWYLDFDGNGIWDGGSVDKVYNWGWAGVSPLVGDWGGDGRQKIGFFINGYWYLDYNGNGIWEGSAVDRQWGLGQAGDTPVPGRW